MLRFVKIRGKIFQSFFLAMLLLLSMPLSACTSAPSRDGVQIVVTAFPAYDFVRQLTGNCTGVTVRMLLSPGTESHSYDPSAADMMAIHDADLFLYIGHGGDLWAERVIASAGDQLQTFALTDAVSLLCLEDDEIDHDHEHGAHGANKEFDPHIWTSPVNAIKVTETLADILCSLPDMSEENQIAIRAAEESYTTALSDLDRDFRNLLEPLSESEKLLVFGDRFPFRYFAAEYGLSYLSAFPGCSEESEPAASTVAMLIDTVRDRQIRTVFYTEFSQHRIADTIAAETGARTAMLHSCHNVTQQEYERGETYLTLMRSNLETLKIVLGE